MKPYIWKGDGVWFFSRGKNPLAIMKSLPYETWSEAIDAALEWAALP